MELSVTPAGSLRLCKAMGGRINEVKNAIEPGMQADQWGEAGSAADGVRSNVTLDSVNGLFNSLCMFLLLGGRPNKIKKIQKMITTSTQTEVLHAVYALTCYASTRTRTSLFSTFLVFYTPDNERYTVLFPAEF